MRPLGCGDMSDPQPEVTVTSWPLEMGPGAPEQMSWGPRGPQLARVTGLGHTGEAHRLPGGGAVVGRGWAPRSERRGEGC